MRKGAIADPIPIGQPTALVAADLERLREPRYVASTPQKLRDSHHMIARLTAGGNKPGEVAKLTGYSRERVTALLSSPAMEELVAQYRLKVDEAFVENQDTFFAVATANMLAAERHISDHIAELDEAGELLPVRTALAISRDAADRFGYGKKTVNLNIHADFATQLEKAIKRSGKGPLIEGAAQPPQPRREPSHVGSPPTQASRLEDSPRPRVLRRA